MSRNGSGEPQKMGSISPSFSTQADGHEMVFQECRKKMGSISPLRNTQQVCHETVPGSRKKLGSISPYAVLTKYVTKRFWGAATNWAAFPPLFLLKRTATKWSPRSATKKWAAFPPTQY
jgi:hypothetical protein